MLLTASRALAALLLLAAMGCAAPGWLWRPSPEPAANPGGRADHRLEPGASATGSLGAIAAGRTMTLTASLLGAVGDRDEYFFTLNLPGGGVFKKTLHAGDPDFYIPFAAREAGEATYETTRKILGKGEGALTVSWREWKPSAHRGAILEAEPNNIWQEANAIELGRTVFASGDDAAYILPLDTQQEYLGEDAKAQAERARAMGKLYEQGSEETATTTGLRYTTIVSNLNRSVDWYRFDFAGPAPRLVMFGIDLVDRDNIPCDVTIWRESNGEIEAYERGVDPVTPPHEVQALPGNKFTTRVLEPGTYYRRTTTPGWLCGPAWITSSARAIAGTRTRRGSAGSSSASATFTTKRQSASPATRPSSVSARR